MWEVKELRDYLARPERPVALIDRRYWRDFQRESRPTWSCSRIPIQGQDLYIVRGGARG